MELELRRTRDTLKWAPQAWRPERSWRSQHAMRKVQSDPCFTSTFTRLPAVFNQNNSSTSSPSSKHGDSSSPSRLMRGPTVQVGKVNDTSKVVSLPNLHSSIRGDTCTSFFGRSSHRKTTFHSKTTDLEDQLKEFENSIEAVQASVNGIHTAVETFEGIAQGDNRKSLMKRGSQISLYPSRANFDDDGDKVEDSWKSRFLQYRYVRKIEPEAPPLERLPPEPCPRIDEGRIILRNQSEEYLKKFTIHGKKNAKVEVFAKRNMLQKEAHSKRQSLEQIKETERLEKMALYQERMATLATRQNNYVKMDSEVRGTEARLKDIQTQKWQSLLAIVGFMQMCSLLHEKYKSVKTDYVHHLRREESLAVMDPGSSERGLPAFLGEYLLCMRFAEVARTQMKTEWRLPPKMRSIWHAAVRSETEDQLKAVKDIKYKRPKMNERSRSKERVRSKDEKKNMDAVRHLYVEFPSRPEMLAHQRNALFLQAILVSRFRLKRKRKASRNIVSCLAKWKKGGSFLVCMMNWIKHVKRIQRFWRWARQRWSDIRTTLDTEWMRLERNIFAMNAHPSPVLKDPQHRMTVVEAQSQNSKHNSSPRDKQPAASQAKPSHVDGEQGDQANDPIHKPCNRRGTRRQSYVNQDAARQAAAADERRRRFLTKELRDRRKQYLRAYAIWQMESYTYNKDVLEWREHRKVCAADGVRPFMDMPSMPPCPSCLPSEEELQEMVQRASGNKQPEVVVKKTRKQTSQLSESWYCDMDNDCTNQFSAEMANVLEPSLIHPPV